MTAAETKIAAPEPWLSTVLRVVVHAVTAGVLVYPLSVESGAIAAATGAAIGSVLGRVLATRRLRLAAIVAGGVGVLVLGVWLRGVVVESSSIARSLGPASALALGEMLVFGVGAFAVSGLLRAASGRYRSLAALEVAAIGLAFAQLVVAHRDGAINRPFDIADPLIAQGQDPTVALYLIGGVAAVVITLLLLSERSLLRSALHVVMALIALFFVVTTAAVVGVDPPETDAGLGLRSEEQEEGEDDDGGGRRNNEELEFRDNYDTQANQVPVAVVLLHDDYSPPGGVYYFRQGAFSQYNGQRLSVATRQGVDEDIADRFATRRMAIEGAPAVGPFRAPIETSVALMADHARPFGLESPIDMVPATNPNPQRFRRVYRVTSAALSGDYVSLLGRDAGSPAWTPEIWDHYTAPPEDARYGDLAAEILDSELPEHLRRDPMAMALAVSSWLGREGIYSLRSSHSGADDPTASFLFGDRTGFCVHFAHASAYLMRAMGLPARVATGYAVDESSRQGGSGILLTGAASHAWPEIYIEGAGWVVVDVSPERIITPPPGPPDPDLQRLLAELLRGQEPVPIEAGPAPPVDEMAVDAMVIVGTVLGALAAALLAFLVLGKAWRRLSPVLASDEAIARVLYRAELDRLAELSLKRRFGESREAFAERVGATVPSFAKLTRVHVGARYGGVRDSEAVRDAAKASRAELAKAFPFWRRAVGVLTPWSWLFTR